MVDDESDESTEARIRAAYDRSREIVRRAHDRAHTAVERAARMREALQRARTSGHHAGVGTSTTTLLQLAADETARVIQEKERLLAVLSHELKQPLEAATAAARMLEIAPNEHTAGRARAILQRQLQQMRALVEALSDMSRLTFQRSDLQLELVDVVDLLKAAVDGIEERAADAGLKVELTTAPALPVEGDRARLQQVFTNVLANAVRYTSAPGCVVVSAVRDADEALVSVRDTGKGISPEHLPHIFEPFTRGAERGGEGFGLGLALVRSIVVAHGGNVAADSGGPGQGSVFTIRLPIARAASPASVRRVVEG